MYKSCRDRLDGDRRLYLWIYVLEKKNHLDLDEGYRKDDDIFMCYSVLDSVFSLFTPHLSDQICFF